MSSTYPPTPEERRANRRALGLTLPGDTNAVPDPKTEPLAFLRSLSRGVRVFMGNTEANQILDALGAIREREARAVAALEFYADAEKWKEQDSGIGSFPGEAIDHGATARAALAEPRT